MLSHLDIHCGQLSFDIEEKLSSRNNQLENMQYALDGAVRNMLKKLKTLSQAHADMKRKLQMSEQQLAAKEQLVDSFKKCDLKVALLFSIFELTYYFVEVKTILFCLRKKFYCGRHLVVTKYYLRPALRHCPPWEASKLYQVSSDGVETIAIRSYNGSLF